MGTTQQFKAVLHLFLCLNPFSSLTQVHMPPTIYYIRCWLVIWVHEADKCSLFKNRKCSLLISQDPKGKCKLKICILFLSIWIATHCACTIRKNKSELTLQWSLNFDHNMLSLSCTRLMRSSVCCPSGVSLHSSHLASEWWCGSSTINTLSDKISSSLASVCIKYVYLDDFSCLNFCSICSICGLYFHSRFSMFLFWP